MSNKQNIEEMLVNMGFSSDYIRRAFKVYEKNYGHSYNVEVITETIVRLQNKDKAKQKNKGAKKAIVESIAIKKPNNNSNKIPLSIANNNASINQAVQSQRAQIGQNKPPKSGKGGNNNNNNNNGMNNDSPPKAFTSHTQYQSYDNNNMPMSMLIIINVYLYIFVDIIHHKMA